MMNKRAEAEATLPPELRAIFSALVIDYMDASETYTKDHSRRVNYNILAALIRGGWRKPGKP